MENRSRITILMLPPALWLVLLFIVPLGIMAVFSFREGSFGAEREQFTLENYQHFFANRSYLNLLGTSAWIAFQTALIAVVLSYPLAYFLSFRAGEARVTLLTILIVPAWTSFLLRILSWKLILGSGGVLNTFLLSLGVIQEASPLLIYSRAAVVVTLVYVWIPFATLPIFSALERIDRRLLEAAADLGCPPWEAFLRVTLPLSLPGVIAAFFFVFIPTLGEWVTPALVGGAQGIMYGNLIQDQFVRALNWPLGAIMSLVLMALVLVILIIFNRFIRISDLAGA
ncbi:MAG: ABC transporter permease [Anaerolineae bacterium]|nr:ABC transporter permease [Anaerolineae bacterium]